MSEHNIIHQMSLTFAERVVNLCKHLQRKYKYDYVIETMAKQMLKAGTSIGANVRESKAAQSTADFVSELKIALKEGDECAYWLDLMHRTEYLEDNEFSSIYNDNKRLNATLVKIINSTLGNC